MAIPRQAELEVPILEILEHLGGEALPQDVYERIAARFHLSDDDKRLPAPGDPQTPHYRKNIQWAKQKLVARGEVDASRWGIWKITDKGRARLGSGPSPSPPKPLEPKPEAAPAPIRPGVASLRRLVAEHIADLRRGLADQMAELSAEQFEELIAELLKRLGYSEVRRVGGPGDRNIDVTGAYEVPFMRIPVRVQVKHRRGGPNIGPTDVAAFRDRAGGVDHALLMVTNVTFTDGARETASEHGRQLVHLVDGDQLVDAMMENKIGAKEGPLQMPEIDEEFWRRFSTPA